MTPGDPVPNIVTIDDVVQEPDLIAVAMEFVEGETLAARDSYTAVPVGGALAPTGRADRDRLAAPKAASRPLSSPLLLIVGIIGLAGAIGLGVVIWSQSTVSAASARITPPPAPPAASEAPPSQPAAAPAPPAPAPSPGVLALQFERDPFPAAIYDGDQQIGQLPASDQLPLAPGPHRIRLVNDALFLNKTFDVLIINAGEKTPIAVPGLGSAVANVKGELYAGVRIFVDDGPLPLPYPAQIPRLASGSHTIRFAWQSGALVGKELTQTFDVKGGGHVIVRAEPENDRVVVQQIR